MRFKFWLTVLSVVLAFGLGGTAFAFHFGGVADCAGCHSMHGSYGQNKTSLSLNGSFLLTGSDQSSTCLNCHAAADAPGSPNGYHVMTYPASTYASTGAPTERTPGGDFAWLLVAGNPTTKHPVGSTGHNIIALDYGLSNLSGYTTTPSNGSSKFQPGTTSGSTGLYCNSCHDPHNKLRRDGTGTIVSMVNNTTSNLPIMNSGSDTTSVPGGSGYVAGSTGPVKGSTTQAVGVYRILAGYNTYTAGGQMIPYNGVPMAIVPQTYNQTESATQVRVAYGIGGGTAGSNAISWGAWCATCHTGFDNGGVGAHYHPIDASAVLSGTEGTNYNAYVTSGNMSGGGKTYLSLVPFATGSSDVTVLAPLADSSGTVNAGPGVNDQVTCLTCHRAHASGWQNALRWDTTGSFITAATGWPDVTGITHGDNGSQYMTAAQVQAAYYDRAFSTTPNGQISFGPFQRSLCNKCHAQD